MRKIIKEHTKTDLKNDAVIDLVVDFFIHPHVNDGVHVPSFHHFNKLAKKEGHTKTIQRFLACDDKFNLKKQLKDRMRKLEALR